MGNKVWIALAAAVVVLLAGVTLLLTRNGQDSEASRPSEAVTTDAGAGGSATAGSSLTPGQPGPEMLMSITNQLQQAVNNGGQPRALTAEEVEAMLRQQLQQIGIPAK